MPPANLLLKPNPLQPQMQLPQVEAPIAEEDPLKRVQQVFDLIGDVNITITAERLATLIHIAQVGLTHPQFDHCEGNQIGDVEAKLKEWCAIVVRKNPGIEPLFLTNWDAIENCRQDRYKKSESVLPSDSATLRGLAKFFKIENWYLKSDEDLRSEISSGYVPEVIRDAMDAVEGAAGVA